MKLGATAALILVMLCVGCVRERATDDAAAASSAVRVIVVRHTERADDGSDDPGLTEAGRAWAQQFARFCAARGVTGVIATPYRRTMETAWPTASLLNLPVRAVPVSNNLEIHVESIARLIEGDTSRVWLVVGHSNTVPAILKRLAGDNADIPAIDESDYGRVFELRRVKRGTGLEVGELEID